MFDERDPKVISYVNNEGAAGQFVKIDGINWNDVSLREDKSYIFRFIFSRFEGTRLYLKDNTRGIEVEIDQDNKQIWWIDGGQRTFLYRIVGIA
jgi:hypothetical protein